MILRDLFHLWSAFRINIHRADTVKSNNRILSAASRYRYICSAMPQVGVVRQAESAALKAAGLTETGKKSGTFKRELAAVFSQVKLWY